MSCDVLLVNPNRMRPPIAPLALEYLATALEKSGLRWALCDLCFAADPVAALAEALAEHTPRFVAISWRNSDDCYCATQHSFIPDMATLVAQIRAQSDCQIVFGGAGFSVAPAAFLELTGAELGVVGDGEEALVRLGRGEAPAEIPGLLWREGEEIHFQPPRWEPFGNEPLARDLLDNGRYFREGGQGGLETKRGCPQGCLYCADPLSKGRRLRLRPPAAVLAEAKRLIAQGVNAVHLCDSEFNLPLEHAKAVCEEWAAARLDEQWRFWAYLAPTPFDAELALLLRRASCAGINFGVDSGDEAMLRRLGRAHTPDDLRATVRLCRQYGLPFMFDLLLGGPGETFGSMARTIALMKTLEPDCVGVAFGVRIYAGTALARLVRQQGFTPANPNLRGRIADNEAMAWPVFYVESSLGEEAIAYLHELIDGDRRFFFGWPDEQQPDYNYDNNAVLIEAIAQGARGAYWDILRQQG